MEILLLLLPLSVVLVFLIAAALWWSIEHGQFDDLEGPAYRILSDEDRFVAQDATRLDADQRTLHPDPAQSRCSHDAAVARGEGAFR